MKVLSNRFKRLPAGGLLDREKLLSFSFDKRKMTGYHGDTLASALLANGQTVFGRSFKYHRPRGLFTAGPEEPNALAELRQGSRREPNTKMTTVELYDGLVAESQNRWPSLKFDIQAVNSLFTPLLVAGFYYKTFMWPASLWEKLYEPLIRRAAGLGRAADASDPDAYEQAFAFCDVLVIGGGPSGLTAALTAGRSGARVILCDEDFHIGGRVLSENGDIGGIPFIEWVDKCVAELEALPNVRVLRRTAVFGAYDGQTFGAVERVSDHLIVPEPHQPRQRLWRIVTKQTILAAGAIERGIVFGGNDRPGVMLASAVRSYLNRFALRPDGPVVIFTNNDDGWRTAFDLISQEAQVEAVIDSREEVSPRIVKTVGNTRVVLGGKIMATHGRQALQAVEVRTRNGVETISASVVAISGGWNPNLGISCHRGAYPQWDASLVAFVPSEIPGGMTVAGAANGAMTLSGCLTEGSASGARAAEDLGFRAPPMEKFEVTDSFYSIAPCFHIPGSRQKAFVDFQNDVTADDITLSAREGFTSVEHLKRYTTLGMATDQGKTSNLNGLAILAKVTGRDIPETGITTYRPPHVPVAIGAFAGTHRAKDFRPARLTPSHNWAEEQGAIFVETGPWLRAQYFPRSGEADWLATVNREVQTVRTAVGFCDVSTLGKIEIHGADAGQFLDRLYINTFSTLAVGKARYGVMLREDGFVLDDGTTSRVSNECYFMTTTTANAGRVFQHIKFCHQILWPDLDVQFVSATDEWAQFSVAGPRARDTLREIVEGDISNEALPYMGVVETTVCGGVPARLYRLSFSGELAYEIGVPARYGESLARTMMQTGKEYGIAPYGTEALGVMRIEKGHVAGNEIDGRTTATDLGFVKMMSKKKDYIGRVLAERPALQAAERMLFVGLRPLDKQKRLRAGSHLIPKGEQAIAKNDEGVVTSVAFSPSLGHWIGLGLLKSGATRLGERICAADPLRGSDLIVEVCNPCFIDVEGARLRG